MNCMSKNLLKKLELLDILFSEHRCDNCNHGYNCTGYGTPCHAWVHITKAGQELKDHKGDLDWETEMDLLAYSAKEIEDRHNV